MRSSLIQSFHYNFPFSSNCIDTAASGFNQKSKIENWKSLLFIDKNNQSILSITLSLHFQLLFNQKRESVNMKVWKWKFASVWLEQWMSSFLNQSFINIIITIPTTVKILFNQKCESVKVKVFFCLIGRVNELVPQSILSLSSSLPFQLILLRYWFIKTVKVKVFFYLLGTVNELVPQSIVVTLTLFISQPQPLLLTKLLGNEKET